MAVMKFGSIYACSRCPGWQVWDGNLAVLHANNHMVADMAAHVCPVCLHPWDHTREVRQGLFAEPCGHFITASAI